MALTIEWPVIDCHDLDRMSSSWQATLDFEHELTGSSGGHLLLAKEGSGARLGLIPTPDCKVGKNRLHLDLRPDDHGQSQHSASRPSLVKRCTTDSLLFEAAVDDCRMSSEPAHGVLEAIGQAARADGFALDAGQARAAARLDELSRHVGTDRGVYLWGPVGRGKTWLLDNFFVATQTQRKKRVHFQAFFGDYHRAVHNYGIGREATDSGVNDLLGDVELVCFDEFHAHDPGDATLLHRLLRALLVERTASIVITSNYEPDALLPNRRYHHTMQPGIDLIKSTLDIVAIDASVDYRELGVGTRVGFRAGTYRVATHVSDRRIPISVGTRSLQAIAAHDETIVFDFEDLCARPVSSLDVLHLCSTFREWMIHNVPKLHQVSPEAAQRFINFVDVLHDQNATLHVTSRHTLADLISGQPLPPDVLRARSRLSLLDHQG